MQRGCCFWSCRGKGVLTEVAPQPACSLPAQGPRRAAPAVPAVQVAEVCVAALVEPAASGKVVEIIAEQDAPNRPVSELFASV